MLPIFPGNPSPDRSIRLVLILALLLAAGLLVADCVGVAVAESHTDPDLDQSPSLTKSPLPSGWTMIRRAADGSGISIPLMWRAIDTDPADHDLGVQDDGRTEPEHWPSVLNRAD